MYMSTSPSNDEHKPLFRDANSDDIIYSDSTLKVREIHKPGAYWIPATGLNKWDGHVYISGATGSGKTYLINQILKHDKFKDKRERIYFTDKKEKDKSIKAGHKKFGDPGIDNGYVSAHINENMFIFDDVTVPDIIAFRDNMLLKARYRDATVISVNHKLRDGYGTKHPLNESRYIVTFPWSNNTSINKWLNDAFNMNRQDRKHVLDKALNEGRHLIFHMEAPQAYACTETAALM